MTDRFNKHGGLALVGLSGYEALIDEIARLIESKKKKGRIPHTSVDIVRPEFRRFSNGEPDIRLGKRHVGGHDVVLITSGPGTDDMIMQTTWALEHLAAHRASRILLVTGYLPLGRSDKDEPDIGNDDYEPDPDDVGGRFGRFATPPMLIGHMTKACMHPNGINCLLDRIVCTDPHSIQVTSNIGRGFITPIYLTRRLLRFVVKEALETGKKIVLAFPDNSSVARFEPAIIKIQRSLNITIPIVVAIKRRDIKTAKSKLIGMQGDIDDLPGSLVIMCDDEVDTGGSIISMATLVREMYKAQSVWATVIHGVFSEPAPTRFMAADSPVDRIITMNTIPHNNRPELGPLLDSGKLHMKSWLDDLAWCILMHHWDQDMRQAR